MYTIKQKQSVALSWGNTFVIRAIVTHIANIVFLWSNTYDKNKFNMLILIMVLSIQPLLSLFAMALIMDHKKIIIVQGMFLCWK